ncbi:hypothetical protein CDD83_5886 [Cordyceps sp. RAO-2017]|nr:hypothetical protein CDD83_5886 [Cordyceps sp. RAO-2017]
MGYHAPAWFLDELVDGIGAYLARGDCARTRDARCAYETFLAHNGLWGALVAHVAAAEEAPRAVRVP